jgi:diguanylate cyclase (GGDEF)-like protein
MIPLVVVAACFAVMGRGLEESARPEYKIAASWAFSQIAIAVSVALTGGLSSAAVAWFAVPLVTLPARFTGRGVAAGVVLTATLLGLATLGDVEPVAQGAERILFPLALLVAVALLSSALMQSDREHRSEAIVDALTGMLNRNALATRVVELAEQARVHSQPVALVIGDLDRFKTINDKYGHSVGDAVLRDVADRIRRELRAFDLAYRLGGEEFLVVLPGSTVDDAAEIAEKLRRAIAGEEVACGLTVTMSFGVAASEPGAFDYELLFAEADMAMYAAKHAGRDCVRARGVDGFVSAL